MVNRLDTAEEGISKLEELSERCIQNAPTYKEIRKEERGSDMWRRDWVWHTFNWSPLRRRWRLKKRCIWRDLGDFAELVGNPNLQVQKHNVYQWDKQKPILQHSRCETRRPWSDIHSVERKLLVCNYVSHKPVLFHSKEKLQELAPKRSVFKKKKKKIKKSRKEIDLRKTVWFAGRRERNSLINVVK